MTAAYLTPAAIAHALDRGCECLEFSVNDTEYVMIAVHDGLWIEACVCVFIPTTDQWLAIDEFGDVVEDVGDLGWKGFSTSYIASAIVGAVAAHNNATATAEC